AVGLQGRRHVERPLQLALLQRECSMVRRGSTVRVRQRALQKPRKSRLSRSAELARPPVCGRYGAVYGALSSEAASGKRQKLARQDRAPSRVRGRADIFGGRQRLAERTTSS